MRGGKAWGDLCARSYLLCSTIALMDLVLALGIGAGFAAVAGVRAFVSLVLVLYASFALFASTPSHLILQISSWISLPVLTALLALAALECVLDKVDALGRPLNRAMVPVRAAVGAALFALAMVVQEPFVMRGPMSTWRHMTLPEGLPTLAPWLITGALIAGSVAVAKAVLHPSGAAENGASITSSSFREDLVVAVGSFLGSLFLLPLFFVPVLLVAALLFRYYRLGGRRGTRLRGLGVLVG